MSRFTNRGMSEYEGALDIAMRELLAAVLHLGADRGHLLERLTEAEQDFETMGATNGAATLQMLIRYIT